MPLPVQNPRASGELQRAYDVVGRLKLLLDEVVVPVHIVGTVSEADDFHPQLYSEAGVGWFSGLRNDPASAGVLSSIALTNPAGSGILAVVSQILIANVSGGSAYLKTEVPAAQVLDFDGQTGAARDTRYQPANPGPSACTIGDLSAAVVAGLLHEQKQLLAGTSNQFAAPLVLGPGTRALVVTSGVNLTIRAGFIWTEIPLPRSQT